ncbi:helix-turn-helix domain-containing protein [Salipiger manganoxidans]|uniref:helix-turn-helix domain-containing protein n=1 Tax=Salipiger marinus TaxID=555512 RepID=UPI001E289CC2|nr:helix-turn-helix domain-containing protein [Salipiger manganoxidans]MCD1620684.1 helix-turn-helix domain-containing protein [Salipiger manganoxidans]
MSFEPKNHAFAVTYPEILTEPEAADFLRIGLTKLREMRREKLVPHNPKKPIRYLKSSLLEWMKEQEVPVKKSAPKPEPKRSTTYKTNTDKSALRKGILG